MTTPTVSVPSDMGYRGMIYRSLIGLHRRGLSAPPSVLSGPLWDVTVGELPFLIAPSEQYPYVRETVPVQRDRIDQARDPGEASLDSGVWIRGQTSWHLGAGQLFAEPLEGDPEEARFRFADSGGVDVWTPGELSLLDASTEVASGGFRCLGVATGVVVNSPTQVRLFAADSSSTTLRGSGVTFTGPLTVSGSLWFAATTTGVSYGPFTGPSATEMTLVGVTALSWAKDRLWVGAGPALYEVTTLAPLTLPGTPIHTFRSGTVVDVEAGAGGLYVMVRDGQTTSIYVITTQNDGTLDAPREVAVLPRGEVGLVLYGYLGRYLAVGTSRGLRIADCSVADYLPVGPVVIPMVGGCTDAVGYGNHLWVTGGEEGVSPDTTARRPGLYRVDLSSPIGLRGGDTAAARFPYATDLMVPGDGTMAGRVWSVTWLDDRAWFVAGATTGAGSSLYRQDVGTRVPIGWLDSGEVTFSTAERKAWLSFSVDAVGVGFLSVEADSGLGWAPVTSVRLPTPIRAETLDLDSLMVPASSSLRHRVTLTGDGTPDGSPVLRAIGVRATPAPRRTRYIRMPLLCYDLQVDANNTPVGYDGFAADRLADLEELESEGLVVDVVDRRLGTSVRCTLEKVSFTSVTPPSRRFSGFGGIINLALLQA